MPHLCSNASPKRISSYRFFGGRELWLHADPLSVDFDWHWNHGLCQCQLDVRRSCQISMISISLAPIASMCNFLWSWKLNVPNQNSRETVLFPQLFSDIQPSVTVSWYNFFKILFFFSECSAGSLQFFRNENFHCYSWRFCQWMWSNASVYCFEIFSLFWCEDFEFFDMVPSLHCARRVLRKVEVCQLYKKLLVVASARREQRSGLSVTWCDDWDMLLTSVFV